MKFNEEDDLREIAEEEVVKQNLLSKAQISLILGSYHDIFSSFDARPFTYKALSDDFLVEAKKATLDKEGAFELSFMVPKKIRNFEHETMIKKRLRDHFRRHAALLEEEIKKIKKMGSIMAITGVIMILIASFLLSLSSDYWLIHFLIVLLEPGGWFTAWTGLDEIYYTARQKRPDLDFYHKMTQAEITFHAY